MRIDAAGDGLVQGFESCKLAAYPDPGSHDGRPWTIGWGHTGPEVAPGLLWTQDQADHAYRVDMSHFEADVTGLAPLVTQNQFNALVSFCFNLGAHALRDSTLLKYHNQGKYAMAASEFLKWTKNDGVVSLGLVRRRKAERDMYLAP